MNGFSLSPDPAVQIAELQAENARLQAIIDSAPLEELKRWVAFLSGGSTAPKDTRSLAARIEELIKLVERMKGA